MSSQQLPPELGAGDSASGSRGSGSPRLVSVARAARHEAHLQAVAAESAVDTGEDAPAARRGGRRVRIDAQALKTRWFRDDKGERNTLSRDFQDIKRPLLARAFGRGLPALPNGRRIMVTSALPREGKTFCAINLALSIAAERDHGVLLVDADVARPSVPRELGFKTDLGLIDWLADERVDVADLVLGTNIKRFSILPAGRRHNRATELLGSDSMRRLLDRLSELYPDEIIVFDSPPLMVTSEAHALASHMGQIVMVVAAGQTRRDVVTDALAKLEGAPVVGVVLNKVSQRNPAYYGAY